jgi:hypothetical protein
MSDWRDWGEWGETGDKGQPWHLIKRVIASVSVGDEDRRARCQTYCGRELELWIAEPDEVILPRCQDCKRIQRRAEPGDE